MSGVRQHARFWTAPVLWRFGRGRGMNDGRKFVLGLITLGEKSGRGLPQSKTLARVCTATGLRPVFSPEATRSDKSECQACGSTPGFGLRQSSGALAEGAE